MSSPLRFILAAFSSFFSSCFINPKKHSLLGRENDLQFDKDQDEILLENCLDFQLITLAFGCCLLFFSFCSLFGLRKLDVN